jgi:hypothetical protein
MSPTKFGSQGGRPQVVTRKARASRTSPICGAHLQHGNMLTSSSAKPPTGTAVLPGQVVILTGGRRGRKSMEH